jgi:hypothetical protein
LKRTEQAQAETNPQVWRDLASVYIKEGDLDLGLLCRQQAITLAPDDTAPRIELLRDLLRISPGELEKLTDAGFGPAFRSLAAEHLGRGDIDSAISFLKRAVEISEDHQAKEDLVRLLIANNRLADAAAVAERVDVKKIRETYPHVRYKDVTAEEKCTLIEASQITLATPETIVQLIRTVRYVIDNSIPGDLVECGVFQGGNAVVMIRTLLNAGVTDRTIYLYDTFEGFPMPEEIDYEYGIGPALDTWRQFKREGDSTVDNSDWLRFPIEKVRSRVLGMGYPEEKIIFVKGMVEDTIPNGGPQQIALLRLDTDFYRSTKHELIHLYPKLSRNGVLIIDDYGALHGARVATDEYFKENNIPFYLNRLDEHVRSGVKTTE